MKKYVIIFLFFVLVLSSCQYKNEWQGHVSRVIDGDTIVTVIEGHEVVIRIAGIDCPELKQPFGKDAKQYTEKMVYGKLVTFNFVDLDRYKRIVAIIYLHNGDDLAQELIKQGFAWNYHIYKPSYSLQQGFARDRKSGLWKQGSKAVPPWIYRRDH